MTAHQYRYTVLFEPAEEGGYIVTCPSLPGLVTEGDTLEEHQDLSSGGVSERTEMATISNYALRIPPSLMEEVRDLAKQDDTSVNQFIVLAVAERVGALKARAYFVKRAARAVPGDFVRVLAKAGGEPPAKGTNCPKAGWRRSAREQVESLPMSTRDLRANRRSGPITR